MRPFSIFGSGELNKGSSGVKSETLPSLKLETDKELYRPGDTVVVRIEISNPVSEREEAPCSLLVERLTFELKGIEKLDSQWFATQKPLPGSKYKRGEHVFMDCSTPAIVTNQIVSSSAAKTYVVRTSLPSIMPPSYRGATIRYLYYVRSTLSGQWLILENGHSHRESLKDLIELETRIPLQIWVTQNANGLQIGDGQSNGIVPTTTTQMDVYWKEMDSDSEWTRAIDVYDGGEVGYDSPHDETSSVTSFNFSKDNLQRAFGSSLSLQSSSARSSFKVNPYPDGGRTSFSSQVALPQLSAAEVIYDSNADVMSPQKSFSVVSPSKRHQHTNPFSTENDNGVTSLPRNVEPGISEGYIHGRSYNIRLDDQVLLRFSPRNSDSTYYFSDMIGGTLTFFHEEDARKCLEVSITLETAETLGRRFVHPSRKNSLTITKVQSDYHEVVTDLVQTGFLFSIPMDGPMSFSTPHISVQWSLRFEFLITPKNVDWTRYDHPLLIEGRDKSEWVLPITVHAPPPGTQAALERNDKPVSLEPLWVHS